MTYYIGYNSAVKKVYMEIEDPVLLKKYLNETEGQAKSEVFNGNFDKGQELCEFVVEMQTALKYLKEDLEEKEAKTSGVTFGSYTPGLLEDE